MPHRPRIAIGGIAHETHTASPVGTTLDDVHQRTLLTGDALLANARGTDGALGGIIDAATGRATILPTLFASAAPGGPLSAADYAHLRDGLLGRLTACARRYPGIDAAILVLHGAMVVHGIDDAEGALLSEVRAIIGDRPLIAVIDFHANISPAMVEAADILIPYRAYPHTDTRDCGIEALETALAMHAGMRPAMAWRPHPLRMPLTAQATIGEAPFAALAAEARRIETGPGVRLAALVPGFPYSDEATAGASVLVVTEGDPAAAHAQATSLAGAWWDARDTFSSRATPLARIGAFLHPNAASEGPVVFADIADNPGAGAPGDSTWLPRALMDAGAEDVAVATIADPGAVAACHEAGPGATLPLSVGGHYPPWSGPPLDGAWTVQHLGDGVIPHHGPIGRGSITRLGRTATVSRGGMTIIIAERRAQVLEPGVFTACGIDPAAMRGLVVKSSVHYRAAFASIATRMVEIDSPGLCTEGIAMTASGAAHA